MKTSFYVIVDKKGNTIFRKEQFTTKPGQIPVKINLNIPDSAFKEPTLIANIEINEEQFKNTIEELEFNLTKLKEQE